jgi:hypothetical protein
MSLSSAETDMGLKHISRIKMQKPSDPIALIVICMKKGKFSSCNETNHYSLKKMSEKETWHCSLAQFQDYKITNISKRDTE